MWLREESDNHLLWEQTKISVNLYREPEPEPEPELFIQGLMESHHQVNTYRRQ